MSVLNHYEDSLAKESAFDAHYRRCQAAPKAVRVLIHACQGAAMQFDALASGLSDEYPNFANRLGEHAAELRETVQEALAESENVAAPRETAPAE